MALGGVQNDFSIPLLTEVLSNIRFPIVNILGHFILVNITTRCLRFKKFLAVSYLLLLTLVCAFAAGI